MHFRDSCFPLVLRNPVVESLVAEWLFAAQGGLIGREI